MSDVPEVPVPSDEAVPKVPAPSDEAVTKKPVSSDEALVKDAEDEENRQPVPDDEAVVKDAEKDGSKQPVPNNEAVVVPISSDEAVVGDAKEDESQPPSLKSGLSENLQDMGIESAEDTNDATEPMDTGNGDKTDLATSREDDEVTGDEEATAAEINQQIPQQESKEEKTKDENEDKQSKTKTTYDDISDSDESDQTGVCDESSETCSTKEHSNKETDTTKNKEKERTPVRRSRSKDEDEEEKGKSDENQKERLAKKPKTDEDATRQQRVLRSRVARPDLSRMNTLEDFGYEFNENGEMRHIKTGSPFVFEVVPNDRSFNQRHYEALGEIITEHVFGLLESMCNLQKAFVPVDASEDDPRTFIFVSENILPIINGEEPPSEKKLLVLIHGSGVVRAGQWARRLIINNNLDMGTMIPYINKAKQDGYEVMVLNTNYNSDKGQRIPNSSSPEAHGKYVWKQYISEWPGKVAIVAHSAGGYVTVEMAKHCAGFMEKVFAIGFTDSVHSLGYYTSKQVSNWFIQHSKNWVSSSKPLDTNLGSYGGDCPRVSAGSPKHEETSYYCMDSVFKFFHELNEIDEATKMYKVQDTNEEEASEDQTAPNDQEISRTEKRDSGDAGGSKKVQTHTLQELDTKQDNGADLVESSRTVGNNGGDSPGHSSHELNIALESEPMEGGDGTKEEL